MTLLSLCELADVKTRLGISDSSNDTLLTDLIASVSRAVERYCDREFYEEERTEIRHVFDRDAPVSLRAYPVTSISTVKNSTSWDWDNTTAIEASNYDVDDDSGLLYVKTRLSVGRRALQVVYTAGLGTTAAAVASSYPDLAGAVEMQVVEEFLRRDSQGPMTYSLTDGGGTGQQQALKMLPAVRERLMPYRRRLL